ncbi:MAG: flavodoxin family protein [Anaerolineales bacterium]
MKATILNGALQEGEMDLYNEALTDELAARGWEVATIPLRERKIGYCVGCFGCWTKTPGVCVIEDDAQDVGRRMIQSDLVVFLTPISFGGPSSALKRTLDRQICLLSPFFTLVDGEIHHKKRYERYPRLLSVGVQAERDEAAADIFTTWAERAAINLWAPAVAVGVLEEQDEDGAGEIHKKMSELLRKVEA